MLQRYKRNISGFTLVETLIVLGIIGIIAGFATPSLLQLNKPFRNANLSLETHIGLMRARAIATGKAHRLVSIVNPLPPNSLNTSFDPRFSHLSVESANNCASTVWKPVSELDFTFPDRVNLFEMSDLNRNNNSMCVDSRGLFIPGSMNGRTIITGEGSIWIRNFDSNTSINLSVVSVTYGGQVIFRPYRCQGIWVCTPVNPDINGVPSPDANGNPIF